MPPEHTPIAGVEVSGSSELVEIPRSAVNDELCEDLDLGVCDVAPRGYALAVRDDLGVEWAMLAACAGALFALLMLLRRRRAWTAGRRVEQHFAWQGAPWRYWPVWLFVILGVVGAVDDGVRLVEIAATMLFAGVWAAVGVLLYRQRRLEAETQDPQGSRQIPS